jgi:hypothetical protein
MSYDPETVLQGIRFTCSKNFQCLTNGLTHICQVNGQVGELGLFVEPQRSGHCQYLFRFPASAICICPVRRRLYLLYGV